MKFDSELAQGLVDDLLNTIHKYDESILMATVLGCLDLVKVQILQDHLEGTEEDDE